MSKLSEEKKEVLAYIDAMLTMIEKYTTFNIGNSSDMSIGASISPIDFLLSIIRKYSSDEELIEWLSTILTYNLPTIELAIKGILLSHLRKNIDCLNDPFIPKWIRQGIEEDDDGEGLEIDLRKIDYTNLLSFSPMSEEGSSKYFGTSSYFTFDSGDLKGKKFYSKISAVRELNNLKQTNKKINITEKNIVNKSQINSIYDLARAHDFNAFLWFVEHKGIKQGIPLEPLNNDDLNDKNFLSEVVIEKNNVNDASHFDFSVGTVVNGNNLSQNMYSLCYKQEIISDETAKDTVEENIKEKTYKWYFAPISNRLISTNWYTNSGTYFNFLLPEKNRQERNLNTDIPLFNLSRASKNGGDYVTFRILPPPYVHVPQVDVDIDKKDKLPYLDVNLGGEPFWRYRKLLFNGDGYPDQNGNYTIKPIGGIKNINGETIYNLDGVNKVHVRWSDGTYYANKTSGLPKSCLYECYKGLTVYDFNYNFVMGMQLFDSKVVASQLIEVATNIKKSNKSNIDIGLNVNKTETAYQMRIAEIINKIINSNQQEISDCFFSFSNNKFNEMMEKSEIKRSNSYDFSIDSNQAITPSLNEAYDILEEYDDNATLIENKDIISRSISQVTASITNEILPSDKYNIKLTLIEELIKSLTFVTVNSLITPKILFLFKINQELLGNKTDLSIEEFLNSIFDLISKIISEVQDLIVQELLNWALSLLKETTSKFGKILSLEQIDYYVRMFNALLKACKFKRNKGSLLPSTLDYVDYADIDETEIQKTDEC